MFAALPASGKSESRRYLKSLNASQTAEFHLGDTSVQIDDYPYVDAMRKIDAAANKVLGEPVFFDNASQMFFSSFDWGTLSYMINDDYFDIKKCDSTVPEQYQKDPVQWLFNRYDEASFKTSKLSKRFADFKKNYGEAKFNEFKKAVEPLCSTILKEKYANIPKSLENKTVVFEFSRGGQKGSKFPLLPPYGYAYSLSLLDPEILDNAAILYIWVTPEQSFQKNIDRAQEKTSQTKSTQLSLNHGVPENVMINEYGTDDCDYLLKTSSKKNCFEITCQKDQKQHFVRVGRFDNRKDFTSGFRKAESEWKKEDVENMEKGMKEAFDQLLGK